jgi:hypothetical protein
MLSVLKSLAYHNVNGSGGLIWGLKVLSQFEGALEECKDASDRQVLENTDIGMLRHHERRIHPTSDRNLGTAIRTAITPQLRRLGFRALSLLRVLLAAPAPVSVL